MTTKRLTGKAAEHFDAIGRTRIAHESKSVTVPPIQCRVVTTYQIELFRYEREWHWAIKQSSINGDSVILRRGKSDRFMDSALTAEGAYYKATSADADNPDVAMVTT